MSSTNKQGGLHSIADIDRQPHNFPGNAEREVFVSELHPKPGNEIVRYIADRTPLFYRSADKIMDSLHDGFFLSVVKETLARLPVSPTFRESHFGEITASIFAEEVLGLRRLYSKLSLLSTQNSNAFKMDVLFCRPLSSPVEFIFGEVKSSPKASTNGQLAGHDKVCYASLFASLNKYDIDDEEFDLAAIKDRLDLIDSNERDLVRSALRPYSQKVVKYMGFAAIDLSTRNDAEINLFSSRKNKMNFSVEVVCLDNYAGTANDVFTLLDTLKKCSG